MGAPLPPQPGLDPYWGQQDPQGSKSPWRIEWEKRNPSLNGTPQGKMLAPSVTQPPPPPAMSPGDEDYTPPPSDPWQVAQGKDQTGEALTPDERALIGAPPVQGPPAPTQSYPGTVPGMGTQMPKDLPPFFGDRFDGINNNPMVGTQYANLSKINVFAGRLPGTGVPDYGGQTGATGVWNEGDEYTDPQTGEKRKLSAEEAKAKTDANTARRNQATTEQQKKESEYLFPDATTNEFGRQVTGDKYMALWFNMNPKEQAKLREKMVKAGFVTEEKMASMEGLQDVGESLWAALIQRASMLWTSTGAKVTPEDLLDQYASGRGDAKKLTTKTTHDTVLNLSNGDSAAKALSQMLADRLGRMPTKSEKAGFLAALNTYERQHPTKRTTVTNTITGDSTSTQQEGGDRDAFASEYTQKHNQKEYAAVQSATTYYDALMSVIGGPLG